MRQHPRAFTMIEMFVVVVVVAGLAIFLMPILMENRSCARRATCSNNLSNIIKCCHLYADATPNLGTFPVYGSDPDANGLKALNLLYDGYVKDHRVFACPDARKNRGLTQATEKIAKVAPGQTAANMDPRHTAYGYDPGHKPTDARAGVAGDMSDDPAQNSPNHGKDRPGQNVAISAGSVEWLDSLTRPGSSLDPGLNGDDGIYQNDGLPPDYETYIIQ